MSCMIEFQDPLFRFEFYRNKHQQKVLIDALLRYGNLDLDGLACLLELPAHSLAGVHQGLSFLPKQKALALGKLFLVVFSG